MMRRLTTIVLMSGLLGAGCGDAKRFGIEIAFPDDLAREQTARVRVVLIQAGPEANCAALLDGSAAPGDEGYGVEDQLVIDLPATGGADPLEAGEPGPRLFFAVGEDADGLVILHGCAELDARRSGPDVIIQLEWVGPPCEADADCDDGDWCTGDETCTDGRCVNGSRDCADGDACTQDVCNENTDACEHPPIANPGTEGPQGDASCSDGQDNDCDGATDQADSDCAGCTVDGDCDDSNDCTDDVCQAGICSNDAVGDGQGCDDGIYCTDGDACSGGVCTGTALDCSDGDVCTEDVCNEDLDRCENPAVADPPGTEGPVGDPSCSDGEDNDCDGQTDLDDTACRTCADDPDCDDSNACTDDTCQAGVCHNDPVTDGQACDDGAFCTDPDSCTGGTCSGAIRDCSGAADACNTGVCDELADACVPIPIGAGTACQDGLFCTQDDTCDDAGVCQPGGQSPCSGECVSGCDEANDVCTFEPDGAACSPDGEFCNGAEACDGNGACASPGDPCPADPCAACQEATDECAAPLGTACADDGLDCTSNEACDGAGACVGTADHAYCDGATPGSLCVPACSADASGCVSPPATATLVCDHPVDLGVTDASACSFSLTGPDSDGQTACLSCAGLVGAGLVEDADFDDGTGSCSLDGWSLATSAGNGCRAKIDGCAPGGQPRSCCDDFASICDDATFADPVLVADFAVQCGGADPQWRLSKTFDLSGLTDLRLCFDVAELGAGASTGLLIWAEDGANAQVDVFCQLNEPVAGTEGLWRTECVDLPAWTSGSPDTLLTFVVHSDVGGEQVWLDNIRLEAWAGGCAPTSVSALGEGFTGCDTSAWAFPTGTHSCLDLGCTNEAGWTPGIFGDGPALAMETSVDTTGLDGRVRACLRAGTVAPSAGDGLRLLFDAGAGWQQAWEHAGALGPDGECIEICVDLSAIDAAVADNPALGLRLESDGAGTVGIYGLRLAGAQFCAAGPGQLGLSALTGDGAGNYDFTATDVAGSQLFGRVGCRWDPDPVWADQQSIWYHP